MYGRMFCEIIALYGVKRLFACVQIADYCTRIINDVFLVVSTIGKSHYSVEIMFYICLYDVALETCMHMLRVVTVVDSL